MEEDELSSKEFLKDKRIYWSKIHNSEKWEKSKSIYCFHWKIAQWLEKILNKRVR